MRLGWESFSKCNTKLLTLQIGRRSNAVKVHQLVKRQAVGWGG